MLRLLPLVRDISKVHRVAVRHSGGATPKPAPAAESQPLPRTVLGDSKIAVLLSKTKLPQQALSCSAEDLVIEAVKKMAKANVGSLLVFSTAASGSVSTMEVCGIVTERDYLTKMAVEGRSSHHTRVSTIMTPKTQLRVLTPDNSIMEAMELMADLHIRHVPVLQDKQLVGMLSVRDIVRSIVDEYRQEFTQMKDYLHGTTY